MALGERISHWEPGLVDRAIAMVGGVERWNKLSWGAKRAVLFDALCPAGGLKEEHYHNDGSRYWERNQRGRRLRPKLSHLRTW
jgi:hypothetical protein